MSDTPRTDAAAVMVVKDQPFPIGRIAMEPYEAVPADLARELERDLATAQARVERVREVLEPAKVELDKIGKARTMREEGIARSRAEAACFYAAQQAIAALGDQP